MAISTLSSRDLAIRARVGVDSMQVEDVLDVVAAVVVLTVFALRVVPQAGGIDRNALEYGLVSTAAAFTVTRSWRHLSMRVVVIASALPGAALLVCVLAPTGGAGLRDAAAYAYAAATFAFVLAFARTPARRLGVAIAVCALGLDQFGRAFLPWWGGEDPGRMMTGTFYWHNQFGAYMLAIGLVAGVLAVFGSDVPKVIGAMVAPFCAAGVLLSASRGSVLLLAGGWLVLGLAASIQATGRMRALARWALLAVAVVAVTTALTSSLFFPHSGSGSALGGVERRNASTQTAEQNLGFRAAHDKAALQVVRELPLTGTGFHGYAAAASKHLPFGLTRSPYVHNGYLQAAVDGGLLLALPLAVAVLAGLCGIARFTMTTYRRLRLVPAEIAAIFGAAALLAHSAIDIDWTYPALAAMTGLLLALGLSGSVVRANSTELAARGVSGDHSPARPRILHAVLLPLVLIVAMAGLLRSTQVATVLWAPVPNADVDLTTRTLVREDARVISDARLISRALNLAVPIDFLGTANVSPATATALLRRSRRLGPTNGLVQMQRAQLLVATGNPGEGRRLGAAVVGRESSARPFLIGEYAELLAATGDRRQGQERLIAALADLRLDRERNAEQLAGLADTLARIAGADTDVATSCALWDARSRVRLQQPASAEPGPQPVGCAARQVPTAPAVPGR